MTPTEHALIVLFDPSQKEKLLEQMKHYSRPDLEWIIDIVKRAGKRISDLSYIEKEKVISLSMNDGDGKTEQLSLILTRRPHG